MAKKLVADFTSLQGDAHKLKTKLVVSLTFFFTQGVLTARCRTIGHPSNNQNLSVVTPTARRREESEILF